jgi:4-hydroxy-3-polyprenylbenzoate decarboxylase
MPGIIALQANPFTNYETAVREITILNQLLKEKASALAGCPFIIITDDADFTARNLRNFLWQTFTRCNPSHDIYGINEFTENKHWGCKGPVVFDARIKPHHAPPVEVLPKTEKQIEKYFNKGGSLYGILK